MAALHLLRSKHARVLFRFFVFIIKRFCKRLVVFIFCFTVSDLIISHRYAMTAAVVVEAAEYILQLIDFVETNMCQTILLFSLMILKAYFTTCFVSTIDQMLN